MTLTDIGHCDECGAPFDHCMCETVHEAAERAEREAAERDWADISDWFAALPSPLARRGARPPRWR